MLINGQTGKICLHCLVKLPQNRNIQPSGNWPNGFECVDNVTMPIKMWKKTFFDKMLKSKTENSFNQMAVCILDVFMCLPWILMKQWRALAFVSNSHSLVMDFLSGAKIFMILPAETFQKWILICIHHVYFCICPDFCSHRWTLLFSAVQYLHKISRVLVKQ